jgi:hypothetical protein
MEAHMLTSRYAPAGIAVTILAVVVLFPAAASGTTRGFNIWNDSSREIVLASYDAGEFDLTGPALGTVLEPGTGVAHFEAFWNLEQDSNYFVTYGDDVQFDLVVSDTGFTGIKCQAGNGACAPTSSGLVADGYYYDRAGTVINASGTHRDQEDADALAEFCAVDNRATCTFNPTSEQQILGPQHQVGNAIVNDTSAEQDASINVADTVGTTDGLGIGDFNWQMFMGAGAGISAKYGHTWTTSHTFGQDVDVHCPAEMACAVLAVEPMIRDTGDFTVTLGNTTWHLPGVYFDSPDPDGRSTFTVTATSNKTLTLRPGKWRPPKVLRGTYRAPKSVETSGIAEPSLRLAIAGPATVVAGQKAMYRLALRRSQPAGHYAYSVEKVRVASTVAGHAVGHFLVRSLPPFKARRLRMTLRVPSTPSGTFCIRATASARHARGASARACSDLTADPG